MIRPSLSEAGSGPRRMLVLGGTGMLGHVLYREGSRRLDAHATVRADSLSEVAAEALDADRTLTGVRIEDLSTIEGPWIRPTPKVVVALPLRPTNSRSGVTFPQMG